MDAGGMPGRQGACKGCERSARVSEEDVRRLLRKLEQSASAVPDEVYRARLSACSRCDSLWQGHTCMHCGCIVAVRAKLEGSDCPHPLSSRWADSAKINARHEHM